MKEFWDLTQASDGTVTDQAQGTAHGYSTDDLFYGMTIDVPDYSIQFAEPVKTDLDPVFWQTVSPTPVTWSTRLSWATFLATWISSVRVLRA